MSAVQAGAYEDKLPYTILSNSDGVIHPSTNIFDDHPRNIFPESPRGTSEKSRGTYKDDNGNRSISQRIHAESKRYKHTITINQRYLADSVQKAFDAGHHHLAILSDMGSGKSYMLIDHIQRQEPNEVTIVITPLASLCQGNANRYGNAGLNAVNYTELKEETAKSCQVVTTTYNTLPTVERMLLAAGRVINIVAVDESEAGAQFLASGTITNKAEAGESLRNLIAMCKHSVLMDAHCDLGTYLIGSAFTEKKYTLLANVNKAWSGHTYSWHEGRDAAVSLLCDLIDGGKKVFVTATTAGQAKKLHMAIERLGVLGGLRVLAAYPSDDDKDSDALRDAKDNQEMFKAYDLVIASPTVGVGISIDGEHFDSVVSLFVRDKDAPSAAGAMQMPFRVRNIGDKHIHLIRVDQIERGRKLSEWQIMQDKKAYDGMLSVMDAHSFDDSEKAQLFGQLARLHGGFESRLDVHDAQMFDDYYALIDREFSDKGIELVTACPVAEIDKPFAGLNKDIKEKKIADIIAAPVITAAQCADIESRSKYQPRTVTASEKMAVQKHHVISAYHHTPDAPPTEPELMDYLAQSDKGIATGRNNIVRAMLTTPEINRLQKHYRTSRDAADKRGAFVKEQWRLDRVLLDIAGVGVGDMGGYSVTEKRFVDSGLLTTKEKGRSATQQFIELAASYNATKPDTRISIKAVKENPCGVAKKLIETRLKLRCKYVASKKERDAAGDYSFAVLEDQPVLDNLNMMIETRGVFGDLRVLAGLFADDALDKMPEINDFEVQAHIKRNLSKIPHKQHAAVVAEYLRRAALPRADGENITPQSAANVWLYDRANGGKYSE